MDNDFPYDQAAHEFQLEEQRAAEEGSYLSAVATIKDRLLQVHPEMAEPIERLLIQIAA